ncbi:unannotated protein [freshwater metagenome]|uniref:Unannotated protein n=1 Tax=freshwater metagenome TaxID=449393 RepID=A0A6J7G4S8_9ZZZZ|nr:hypothetical protein [Actinomycetota bacterium]
MSIVHTTGLGSYFIAPMIGIIVGGAIGAGAVIGLVSSQTSVPPNVDAPYVVYGNS